MRIKIYRQERGEQIPIGTAIIYINDAGLWRETTKAEMQVLDIQSGITTSNLPIKTSIHFPTPEDGNDGDYYALLYPLEPDGGMWKGEVWND